MSTSTKRFLAGAVAALVCLPASIALAQESEGAGRGSLDRKTIENFDDFADLSLTELLGEQSLRFAINMFADASFVASSPKADGHNTAFAIGPLGFLSTAELGDSIRTLNEFVIETVDEGTIVDLERLWVRWEKNGFFILGGRMHTDFGYWNTAFHHGAWLQTTVARPRTVGFEDEGGTLPVHSTGMEFGYKLKLGNGDLHMRSTIANGRGHNPDDIRVVDDTNNAKSVLATIFYEAEDWRLGVGGLYDRIAPADATLRPDLPDVAMNEMIGNIHFVHTGKKLRLLAEGYAVIHTAGDETWSTLSGYALGSYRIDSIEPYLRVEAFDVRGGTDPFFVPDASDPNAIIGRDLVESVAGIRFNLSEWAALKLEYRFAHPLKSDEGKDEHVGLANIAFGI